MPLLADQRPAKTPAAVRNASIDYDHVLDPGEVIDEVSVVELGGSDLTITSAAPSEAALLILDNLAPAGRAAQFRVAGGTRGKDYRLRVTITTDLTQAIESDCILRVV